MAGLFIIIKFIKIVYVLAFTQQLMEDIAFVKTINVCQNAKCSINIEANENLYLYYFCFLVFNKRNN